MTTLEADNELLAFSWRGPCDKVLESGDYRTPNPFDSLEDNPNGYLVVHDGINGGFKVILPEEPFKETLKKYYQNYFAFKI